MNELSAKTGCFSTLKQGKTRQKNRSFIKEGPSFVKLKDGAPRPGPQAPDRSFFALIRGPIRGM
jgi:hypothetical protein